MTLYFLIYSSGFLPLFRELLRVPGVGGLTGFLETGEVLEVVEVLEAAVEVAGGLPAFFLPPGSFLEVSSAFLEVLSCSVSESLSPTKRSLRLNLESGSLFKSLVALSNNFEASLVSEIK